MTETTEFIAVRGVEVDAETRCTHWRSPADIVAIKFKCCGDWYACLECHTALAGHETVRWPRDEFEKQAILCGHCRSRLTIHEYLVCDSRCPHCGAGFNPGCAKHYDLYFAID